MVPVSQRIWTPRGIGPPGPYPLADLDPGGPYPLADLDPLRGFGPPTKHSASGTTLTLLRKLRLIVKSISSQYWTVGTLGLFVNANQCLNKSETIASNSIVFSNFSFI